MPGFLGGNSSSSSGQVTIYPNATLLDPVSKLRVSNPQTMMDTDFEYGLQPTKWETVELINNTPSFFSASGDTTLPNLNDMTTTAGSREIKVTTLLPHGVSVGIPINVTGSKSLTADGSYIINSVPDTTTFTYLSKGNQLVTASIVDLYTSIITGQFFQGSQIKIADSQGLVTDAVASSTLTVTTDSPHGFGVNTPFYFLNLNSTVSQEFDASNTGAKTFDSSNTATAQSFDGANTLTSYGIDLTNKANVGGTISSIVATNTSTDTVTVTHTTESFQNKPIGTPLYYNVAAASGYFSTAPRGVVYLASTALLGASSSEFQVSAIPGGTVIDITVTLTGTFQLANTATLFAGNNSDSTTQATLAITESSSLTFNGANAGGNAVTVNSYSGTSILVTNNAGGGIPLNWYIGRMLKFTIGSGSVTGLSNNVTYFVTNIVVLTPSAPGLLQIQVAALPGGSSISVSGSGTQTFTEIGVSTDKAIWHVPNHVATVGTLVKYVYPAGGKVTISGSTSDYLYVNKIYDAYNIILGNVKGGILPFDGSSSAQAAPSAVYLRDTIGITTSGNYWIKPDGYGGSAELLWCDMTNQGGGWVLIGAGRASNDNGGGWYGNNTGQNTSYLTSTAALTVPNNTIAKVSGDFVNCLMVGATTGGWQNGKATNYLIMNRRHDATDGLGSIGNQGNGGTGDSFYLKITNQSTFTWVNQWGTSNQDNSPSAPTGTGDIIRYPNYWLAGSSTGRNSSGGQTFDNDNGGSNDWRRLFTWHWSGHGPWHGNSAGSTVTGSGQGGNGGFTNGSEGHAIQYSHVWAR